MAEDILKIGLDEVAPRASSDWRAMLRIGHFVVFGLLGGFILWAATARLDGAAVAEAVVAAESNRKTIQHLEGGIVKEILVRNGDQVNAGQLLVRLDPTRFDAQSDLYKNQLAILLAQETRLMAEYELRDEMAFPPQVTERADRPSVAPVVADQTRLFVSRRNELHRNQDVAQSEIAQARKDIEQNKVDGATAATTLANIQRELDNLMPLYQRQLVATVRITPLEREKIRLQGLVDSAEIQKVKLNDKLNEAELKKRQVVDDYRRDASTALIDVRRMLSDVHQQIVLAEDSRTRTDIRAPIAGVVQQMKIFTVGGVIRPGDPILDIAPVRDDLVVQAKIRPDDVDRVAPGMGAELRFPAFNYWGEKAIRGSVRAISRDRIASEDGKDVYFAAEVVVDRSTLPAAIADRLLAGMTANVLISTGQRTVADYLARPLVERFERSMRER